MCTQIAKICIFARALARATPRAREKFCAPARGKFYKNFAKIFSLRVHLFCQKSENFKNNRVQGILNLKSSKNFQFFGVFGKKYTPTLGSKNLKNPPKSKKYHSDFKKVQNHFFDYFCTSKYGTPLEP